MSNKIITNADNDPSKIEPVHWYDFKQLINTAKRVAESDTFSRNSDRRVPYTGWHNNPSTILFKDKEHKEQKPHKKKEIATYNDAKQNEGTWIDFVADTGDGGNATYTVAKTLFEDFLKVTNHELLQTNNSILEKFPAGLPRADLLVLGGDLVYPVANEKAYKERFIDIFKAALPISESDRKLIDDESQDSDQLPRTVVAFPQNHDWYDNLSSFTLLFSHMTKETFLDMKCPQLQSYAAVELPHEWWLFGLDFALTDDIDELQLRYFKKILGNGTLSKKSRVIIEYPQPNWQKAALRNDEKSTYPYRYKELERLIEEITQRPIDIRLSGDQHHYRRYTSSSKSESHLITCGCGGAFLHPTHGPAEFETLHHIQKADDNLRTYAFSTEKFKELKPEITTYQKKHDYPSIETSWKLSFCNFGFICKNRWFGLITAFSYLLIVWANFSSLFSNIKITDFDKTNSFEEICYKLPIKWNHFEDLNWFDNLSCTWHMWGWSTILSPLNGIIMILVISGFIFFAREFNPHAKWWATILGFLHGCTHFFAIFIIYFFVLLVIDRDPIAAPLEFIHFFYMGACILFLGWFLGSTIMGIYLFTTLNLYIRWISIAVLITVLIGSFLIFVMWFNTFLSTLIVFPIVIMSALFLYKFIPTLKNEILFLHSNEAFSSLREQDYKGFLRFRITKDRLEAFFIGIDKTPQEWEKEDSTKAAPKWRAKEKIIPKLVDYWTVETPEKSNSRSS